MTYQIHQPAVPNADDKWTAAEHNGNLLIFFPTEVRRGIKTTNGDADAVACSRVVNLDTGRVLHNTLIFGTALVPNIGPGAPDGVVLGRLGQGEGKPGQSKPWILLPHDEAELRRCQDWLAQDAQGNVTQPATQQQGGWNQAPSGPAASAPQANWGGPAPAASPAPATGGWGQQAPAPAPQQGDWNHASARSAYQEQWAAQGQAPAAAPAPAQGQFDGQWGNAAPQPPFQAPDPGLVQALAAKGYQLPPGTSHDQAVQIWNQVSGQ